MPKTNEPDMGGVAWTPGPLYVNGEFIYSAAQRDELAVKKAADRSSNETLIPIVKLVNGNFADLGLFAAAPALYEALFSLVSCVESTNVFKGEKGAAVLAKSRAALAKANPQ